MRAWFLTTKAEAAATLFDETAKERIEGLFQTKVVS